MPRAEKIALSLVGFIALSSVAACGIDTEGDDPTAYGAKVSICHKSGSRSADAHVIEVSLNAVSAHLAHGDTVATSCDAVSPPLPDASPPLPPPIDAGTPAIDAAPIGEPDAEVLPG